MTSTTKGLNQQVKILLLERINESAENMLLEAGYDVKIVPKSLSESELSQELRGMHVLGIRSKTKVSESVLENADQLMAIGCFGVGTNQVSLDTALENGIPVFNAPYSSTRSVAELAIGGVVMLARMAADKSAKMHRGIWDKQTSGCREVRGKTIGIVGYGHIGQQLGLLAEAFGLKVVFFDLTPQLPLGNAQRISDFDQLLGTADFVSLNVPAQKGGKPLIGAAELKKMKRGSYLLNLSRGSLVDLDALKTAIESKHIAGASLDVYPDEPRTAQAEYSCPLAGVENVILTPHLGGSTEEAQVNIGVEVAEYFVKFLEHGSTYGSVNFPQINLPPIPDAHRVLNIHRNQPGVLGDVNNMVSELGGNIDAQYLATHKGVGYLIMDVNREISEELKTNLSSLPTNIKTRILY